MPLKKTRRGGRKAPPKERTIREWLKHPSWTHKEATAYHHARTGATPSSAEISKWKLEYLTKYESPARDIALESPAAPTGALEGPQDVEKIERWQDPTAMAEIASKAGLYGLTSAIRAVDAKDIEAANAAGGITIVAANVAAIADKQEHIKFSVLRRQALLRAVQGSVPQEELISILTELGAAAGGWDRLQVRAWWRQRQRAIAGAKDR